MQSPQNNCNSTSTSANPICPFIWSNGDVPPLQINRDGLTGLAAFMKDATYGTLVIQDEKNMVSLLALDASPPQRSESTIPFNVSKNSGTSSSSGSMEVKRYHHVDPFKDTHAAPLEPQRLCLWGTSDVTTQLKLAHDTTLVFEL